VPLINHGLQRWNNVLFPNLEEIAVSGDGLEELHDNSVVRIGRDVGLDECRQHFAVTGQWKGRIIDFLSVFSWDRRCLAKRCSALATTYREYQSCKANK
jgi:hypothetical protein